MRVLVTRAEPSASRTCKLLNDAGHDCIKLPLFEVQDTGTEIPEENFDAYIFTSGNSISVLQNRWWRPANPEIPAFCVGKRTAQNAQKMGFTHTISGNGGGKILSDKILDYGFSKNARLVYLTTPDRSFDLKSHLEMHGVDVLNLEVYQAVEKKLEPETLEDIFNDTPPEVVFSYSRRSADIFAQRIEQANLTHRLSSMKLIAISEQAIGDLAKFNWNETSITPVANEEAMFHILNHIS